MYTLKYKKQTSKTPLQRKRGNYPIENLHEAISVFNNEKRQIKAKKDRQSIKHLAEVFGVPRKTLNDHILKPELRFVSGREPTLTLVEEKAIIAGMNINSIKSHN